MQTSLPAAPTRAGWQQHIAWLLLPLLACLLWMPEIKALWGSWRADPSLSHGPLVPLVTFGLLWTQKDKLREWNKADGRGLIVLLFTIFVYLLAVWADVDFLKPLALIGIVLGSLWFVGGIDILKACLGPVGFLVFMIPWPTSVVDRLAFPLQLTSSAYAAIFAGILGVPIHREGVQLYVQPDLGAPPIYSIIVAQACSGLTSLMVLLALTYLVAYFTPVKLGWRVLMMIAVVPMALLTNATRLTIILLFGAHGNAELAHWVHDHEGPVLIFFCSLGLMGLRQLLMAKTHNTSPQEGKTDVSLSTSDLEHDPVVDAAL